MSDDIKRLRTLIDTYKISRPVSPEHQQYVIGSRMPDLRQVLKKTGRYSLAAWIVIMIFSLFRKYGFHITMIQSKIIAGITAAAVASGSAAAVYGGARYIMKAAGGPASRIEEGAKAPGTATKERTGNEPVAPAGRTGEKKRTSIVNQEKSAPAGEQPQIKEKQGPAKKKKASEQDSISDILTL